MSWSAALARSLKAAGQTDQARAVLLWQQLPDAWGLRRYLGVAIGLAYVGRYFFAKARSGFADVL